MSLSAPPHASVVAAAPNFGRALPRCGQVLDELNSQLRLHRKQGAARLRRAPASGLTGSVTLHAAGSPQHAAVDRGFPDMFATRALPPTASSRARTEPVQRPP